MDRQIKPLQWVSEPPYLMARLPELRAHYAVEAWDDRSTLTGTWFGRLDFDTVSAAKAAAQTDYEARVLSVLINAH